MLVPILLVAGLYLVSRESRGGAAPSQAPQTASPSVQSVAPNPTGSPSNPVSALIGQPRPRSLCRPLQ